MSQTITSKKIRRIPRPEEIVAHLSEAIKGHEPTKRMLACAAYAHLMKCHAKSKSVRHVQSLENCLISGPTGSGKSAMLQRLATYLQLPTVTVLTGSLSPSGYKGKTCNDVLDQIQEVALENGVTRPTLCVWDEYDKCAYGIPDASQDAPQSQFEAGYYKRMAQSDMLGILQGIKLSDRPGLDLGKVLHVACGAFPERTTHKKKEIIGFHAPTIAQIEQHHDRIDPEYFIKQGLMAELVGRYPRLGVMSKPDQSTIREIIIESVTSPFRQKLWFFKQHGTSLQFDDGAIELLAQMVSAHPTGVRALQFVLTQLLGEYEYEITRSDCKSIEEIRYSRDAVAGIVEPLVIRSSVINRHIERTVTIPHPEPPDEEHLGIF